MRLLASGMGAVIGVTGVTIILTTVAPVVTHIATVLGGVR